VNVFAFVEMICDVAAPQQLITASSCNIHFDDDKRSLTCLGFVIARLQSTPTMIPDAPPSVPASTGGLLTAQTASRVARSVTSPKSPAGHLERALSDALISTADIVLHRSVNGTDFIFRHSRQPFQEWPSPPSDVCLGRS